MDRAIRSLFVIALAVASALFSAGVVRADVDDASGTNVQDGNNRGTTSQRGSGTSGDAVGGQVAGVVSSGRTSVDARNTSRDSSVESGEVNGSNSASSFTGQNFSGTPEEALSGDAQGQDVANSSAFNLQDGNNNYSLSQTANASSGDGVAGEVIGVVTAAGGSTSVVAANVSDRVDVTTGDSDVDNSAASFVGQDVAACERQTGNENICVGGPILIADVDAVSGTNVQDGNNAARARQSATATTGDGVAGQVIGAVSGGATSIDASNNSTDVSVDTGSAEATNANAAFVGQDTFDCGRQSGGGSEGNICVGGPLLAADVTNSTGTNVQDGSNRGTFNQSARAASGDGVAGEVIGAVTSAGGSTSIVAANTSRDSDVTTGEATADNSNAAFVGQDFNSCGRQSGGGRGGNICVGGPFLTSDIDNVSVGLCDVSPGESAPAVPCGNLQDGNNRLSSNQSANATTGDGVAGQVIGAVSAGATSIDARNTSDRVSVDTGDADATNDAFAFVGQNVLTCGRQSGGGRGGNLCGVEEENFSTVDVTNSTGTNIQDGNNRGSFNQSARADSGDGVAGEVIGAVTSAGGSASIVAANTSTDSDVTTGNAEATNDLTAFVGLNATECGRQSGGGRGGNICVTAEIQDVTDVVGGVNVQDGSNRGSGSQTAAATTGDGVAGQVIGAVSAGATSIDARNRTADSSVETGDATSDNFADIFVGLNAAECGDQRGGGRGGNICDAGAGVQDVSGVAALNVQDGNNRKSFSQSATASSGDAVTGQVTGVVTSAGGSASVVVDNTSTGIDASSGESEFNNDQIDFVGLNASGTLEEELT